MLVATALRDTAAPADIIYAWLGSIVKVERDKDGNALVYGKVTDGTVDSDEQIVDPAFAKKALAEWYETGANVRQMHATTLPPAGKGIFLESKSDGEYVRTKVVEPTAIKLVDNDVYTGYSVGISRPRIERDSKARGGRIVGGKIVEISLVDRPANPMAKFAVLKARGRGLAFIGKSVTVPMEYRPAPRKPKVVKVGSIRPGAYVEVDVHDEFGSVSKVAGRLAARGLGSIAIDQAGYSRDGDVKRIFKTDIVAVRRRPAADTLTKARSNTEDSVADTQAAPAVDVTPDAGAGGKCGKCGGSGKVDGDKCAVCGGSGMITKAKGKVKPGADQVDPGPDATSASTGRDVGPGEDEVDPGPDAAATDTGRDVGPGEDEVDPGPDADDKTAPKAKVAKPKLPKTAKKLRVAQTGESWTVVKGDRVLGTHPSESAATAHRDAIAAAAKVKRAKQKAAKQAKRARASFTKQSKAETPWLIRRAHDYTCGAYEVDDVAKAYPTIEKDGVAAAVGPAARAAIYTLLSAEIQRDGGSGDRATKIAALSKALDAITAIIDSKADVSAAREEVATAFKSFNGLKAEDATGLPKPSESISPSQFKRGYLSSGHQSESASAHAPNIPTTTHPVRPEDFGRGPVTEGHQRYLTSKLADLHDGLADWRPEICLMDANGSMAFDRQPYPNLDDRPPFLNRVPNQDSSSPHAISPNGTSPIGKTIDGSNIGPTVHALSPADIEEAMQRALVPYASQITKLEATVDALAAAPDPSRSAPRGVTGNGVLEKVSQVGGGARKERQSRKAEKIEFLRSIATAGDPDARLRAQDKLLRMGEDIG